jgi:hypothetical protein
MALIPKITGFPTVNAQTEEFLEKKVCKKELEEQVKVQFNMTMGNIGLIIKEINDNTKRFASNLIACKMLRKFNREEAPRGVITVEAHCTKGMMFSWVLYLLK